MGLFRFVHSSSRVSWVSRVSWDSVLLQYFYHEYWWVTWVQYYIILSHRNWVKCCIMLSHHNSARYLVGYLAAWEGPQLLRAKVKNASGRIGIFRPLPIGGGGFLVLSISCSSQSQSESSTQSMFSTVDLPNDSSLLIYNNWVKYCIILSHHNLVNYCIIPSHHNWVRYCITITFTTFRVYLWIWPSLYSWLNGCMGEAWLNGCMGEATTFACIYFRI